MPNWPCFGLIYARFVDFIHSPESVRRAIFYESQFIPHTKIVPIEAIKSILQMSNDSISNTCYSLLESVRNLIVPTFDTKVTECLSSR